MTREEYNKCVDLYSDGVYRFMLKCTHDKDKSKDIVQDSYEKLWITHSEVSFEKAKSYIFTTAYRTMIDQIRRDKKKVDFETVKLDSYVSHNDYSDLNEILHRALENLPEDQKTVVLLRDYEGYSYEEISEITGLNESQVKVYIYRARVFLKSYIGKLENVI